jgi:pimeloyl-ACP methyl ester carboxylesterase
MHPAPGPLLVLDAAQGTDMLVWDQAFIKELNGFASVLAFNRIGSGKSRLTGHNLKQPVTAKDSSERLHRLLQRLSPERKVILLGHSMGGLYAQYFARAYPQQLSGLVLIDAASALEFEQSVRQIEQAPAFPNIPLLVISADNHHFPDPATEVLWQEIQKRVARQSPANRQVTVPDSEHFVFISNREAVVREIAAMVRDKGFRPP